MSDERVQKGIDRQDIETTIVVDGGRIVVYDSPEELEQLRAAIEEQNTRGVFVFVPRDHLQKTTIVEEPDTTDMPVCL
jgi:hypothetical protein